MYIKESQNLFRTFVKTGQRLFIIFFYTMLAHLKITFIQIKSRNSGPCRLRGTISGRTIARPFDVGLWFLTNIPNNYEKICDLSAFRPIFVCCNANIIHLHPVHFHQYRRQTSTQTNISLLLKRTSTLMGCYPRKW